MIDVTEMRPHADEAVRLWALLLVQPDVVNRDAAGTLGPQERDGDHRVRPVTRAS